MVTLAGVLFAVVVSGGCGPSPQPAIQATATTALPPCATPVKVALMGDKTGSTEKTRTQQIQSEDLNQIVELISRCGGEIALGFVTDESNRSLVRLRVEVPEPPPSTPQLKDKPAFEAARSEDDYRKKKAEHEKKMEKWAEQTNLRKARFAKEAEAWLAQSPNFMRSDVWGALQRAELFIDENSASWPQPPHRYIVLVSDGEDNVNRPGVTINSETQLILINGSATVGSLQRLNPHRFESLDAALRHIIASEEGSK